MNFKFEEDLDNNLLSMVVTEKLRTNLTQPHIMHRWDDVKSLVHEHYTCPKTHTLGECLNPIQTVNNESLTSCVRTWKFNLIPKRVKTKTSARKTSKSKSQKINTVKK